MIGHKTTPHLASSRINAVRNTVSEARYSLLTAAVTAEDAGADYPGTVPDAVDQHLKAAEAKLKEALAEMDKANRLIKV